MRLKKIGAVLFFVLCILALYFLGYYNLIQNYYRAPLSTYYMGFAANYPIDQIGNLSVIQQGYAGSWLRDTHYTTTVSSKKFALKFEYLLIGHLGKLFQLKPIHAYYGATLILSSILIITIWYTIRYSLPKEMRFTAFLLALFSTGFSWKDLPIGWRQLQGDMMVFQRTTTASPHYMIGSIGSLLSMVWYARYISTRRFRWFVCAMVSGMVAMHVFAPSMIIVLIALPIGIGFYMMQHISKKFIFYHSKIFFFYTCGMCIPVIYNRYASQFFDWSTFARTENLLPYVVNWYQYVFLIGAVLIPAVVAVPIILKKGQFILVLFVSWAIAQIIAQFWIRHLIGASIVRFFQTPYYVIYAVIGTYGIHILSTIVKKLKGEFLSRFTIMVFVASILIIGWYTYVFSFHWQSSCFCQVIPKDIGYPPKGIVESFFWIDKHTDDKEAFMSGEYTGLLIPAFTGNRVFTSWWHRLTDHPSYYELFPTLLRFYRSEMTLSQAIDFLHEQKMSYVIYTIAEGFDGNRGLAYDSNQIKEVFRNSQAIIYKVE